MQQRPEQLRIVSNAVQSSVQLSVPYCLAHLTCCCSVDNAVTYMLIYTCCCTECTSLSCHSACPALQVTAILSQLSLIPAHTGLDACSKAAEVLLASLSQSQAVHSVRCGQLHSTRYITHRCPGHAAAHAAHAQQAAHLRRATPSIHTPHSEWIAGFLAALHAAPRTKPTRLPTLLLLSCKQLVRALPRLLPAGWHSRPGRRGAAAAAGHARQQLGAQRVLRG